MTNIQLNQTIETETSVALSIEQQTNETFTERKKTMMLEFEKTEFVRLFRVNESSCDQDKYVLEPIYDNDDYNQEFNLDGIHEEFHYLLEYFFNCGGGYFVIDDDATFDSDGNILLNDTAITGEEEHFIIPDIREDIITKTEIPIYGVVFNFERTKYIWVVAEPTRTEYQG